MSDARLIVEVLWGPQGGRKVAIAPGEKIRVGRTERADLVIPNDTQLSAVHFELTWDGVACQLRDLGSVRGVKVGGAPVTEATLKHGAWIRAGITDFRLWREGGVRPPPAVDERTRRARARVAETLLALSREERLHAVLDAARDGRILEQLSASMEQHRSLYDGAAGEGMAEIAPHLVRFSPGSPLLERLLAMGWGQRWGIFLTSEQPFKEVRRHLRRFLIVHDDDTGERLYFRFYDPEILRVFLPTCSARQARDFWGDVTAFVFEDERGALVRRGREEAIAASMGEAS